MKEQKDLESARQYAEENGIPVFLIFADNLKFVTSGDEKAIIDIAKKLYLHTGQNIGCVRYEGQNMTELGLALRRAINIARKNDEAWHIFRPEEDSLDAKIRKARGNIESALNL